MASTNITTFPGKVGVSNANPTHTLSIGSNVFVDDTGTNKLVVLGSISTTGTLSGDGSGISNIQSSNVNDFASNVSRITNLEASNVDVWSNLTSNAARVTSLESDNMTISGIKTFEDDIILESNLRVQGDLLVANTINMVVSDPIMELGSNNLNTGDIGFVMTRHGASESNVTVFYDETEDRLKIGYTLNSANDTVLALDSNALPVDIQGELTVGGDVTVTDTTSGSAAGPEFSLYRNQTGTNGDYLGQLRFDGKHDGGNDQLYAKITGKIKKADQGGEDGVIETAIITDGSQRISLRHTGDLFHIKKGTDFQVGETANLYVDTATSRVGIGMSNPSYTLDVDGDINLSTGSTLKINGTDAVLSNWTANGSDIYRSSGNVGIGTNNPRWGLEVTPTGGLGGVLSCSDSPIFSHNLYYSGGWKYGAASKGGAYMRMIDSEIQFWNAPNSGSGTWDTAGGTATTTQRMTIDESGKVGIGTASPQEKFHLYGSPIIQHETRYSASSNPGWYKLGTWDAPNSSGSRLKISLLGAESYSAQSAAKGGETIIYASINNNNPTTVSNMSGSIHAYGNPVITQAKFKQVGTDRSQYEIYAYVKTFTEHSMKIECTNTSTFTRAWTGSTDPGADSSTVQAALFTHVVDNAGNVGIGTNAPQAALHVAGDSGPSNTSKVLGVHMGVYSSIYPHIEIVASGSNTGWIDFKNANTGGNGDHSERIRGGSGHLEFITNMSERMRIDSSGNVGIGTNSPAAKLHIGPKDNDHIYLASGNNRYGWILDTDDQGNGTVPFRIIKRRDNVDITTMTIDNASGYVGIGASTSPTELLHVFARSASDSAFIRIQSGSGGTNPATESGIKLTESGQYGFQFVHSAVTDLLKVKHQDSNGSVNQDDIMVWHPNGAVQWGVTSRYNFHYNPNTWSYATNLYNTTTNFWSVNYYFDHEGYVFVTSYGHWTRKDANNSGHAGGNEAFYGWISVDNKEVADSSLYDNFSGSTSSYNKFHEYQSPDTSGAGAWRDFSHTALYKVSAGWHSFSLRVTMFFGSSHYLNINGSGLIGFYIPKHYL